MRLKITDGRPSDTVISTYDVPPPVTTYAASVLKTALWSAVGRTYSTNKTNSAVVNRRPRMKGILPYYAHGAVIMPTLGVPTPGNGGVANSRYQTFLVQLHTWQQNLAWFAAGYPQNLGYSTRVGVINTQVTGSGATNATMASRPLFPRIQRVPRYDVRPPRYDTRSANG
jgi:hypothetical protein